MINELEKILDKCEFNENSAINENNVCYIRGQNPVHCPFMIYYLDECYCKGGLVKNEDKQIEYAKWMEK